MTPKKIPFSYNINRMCAVDLISIIHIDDYDTRFIELHLTDEGEPLAVDGSTVTARFVTVREKYLLSDNVPCEADGNTITIPIDAAAVQSMSCDIKIEVNIVNGEKILTLPFPLWIRVRGSILQDAEITPESKGTIPELLEEVKEELERVQGYVDEEQVKDIIDGVLSGVTTNIPTLLIDNTVNQQYNPEGHLLWYYIDSDGTRHNLFDFTPYIGGTDNYNSLKNKPSINNVTLSGNKTAADLNLQPILPIGSDNELVDATSRGVIKRSGYRVSANEKVIVDKDSANLLVPNARAVAKKLSGITQIKIVSGEVDASGHITFTDSDGNTFTTTGASVIGEDGADGASVVGATINQGFLVLTLQKGLDMWTVTAGYVIGRDGTDGINGAGYIAAEINSSGELVLTYQTAYRPGYDPAETQVNLGRVVGVDEERVEEIIDSKGYITANIPNNKLVAGDGDGGIKAAPYFVTDYSDDIDVAIPAGLPTCKAVHDSVDAAKGAAISEAAKYVAETVQTGSGISGELVSADDVGTLKRSGYAVSNSESSIQDVTTKEHTIPTARAVAKKISGITQIKIVSGAVDASGHITFTDSDGNTFTTTGASVIGPQGAPGQDYVLTPQDKTDIANIVLGELPTTQGVLYGNTSN